MNTDLPEVLQAIIPGIRFMDVATLLELFPQQTDLIAEHFPDGLRISPSEVARAISFDLKLWGQFTQDLHGLYFVTMTSLSEAYQEAWLPDAQLEQQHPEMSSTEWAEWYVRRWELVVDVARVDAVVFALTGDLPSNDVGRSLLQRMEPIWAELIENCKDMVNNMLAEFEQSGSE